MKLTIVSDTHCQMNKVSSLLKPSNILIHCGDALSYGNINEYVQFCNHLNKIKDDYDHIIYTPGNHDKITQKDSALCKEIFNEKVDNGFILIDESLELDNINFFASPRTPEFFYWAWMYERNKEAEDIWNRIPDDTDVLITHGPPMGILDRVGSRGGVLNVGCEALKNKVNKVKPILHCFGHVHSNYGIVKGKNTLFVNASSCNEKYFITRNPVMVEIDTSTKQIVNYDNSS